MRDPLASSSPATAASARATAVVAIWIKDPAGVVVHLAEFDEHHQAERHEGRSLERAHAAFDLSILEAQAGERTARLLTPYALCRNHGTLSIWEGRPWQAPVFEAAKDEL